MSGREIFQIEQIDVIRGRVMLPGNEIGVLRNDDPILRQLLPH